MPGGDGTGPTGKGPGTGRGLGRGRGQGMGRMGGQGAGIGGNCVCPSCGEKIAHQQSVPCSEINCPKCGASMIRE